MSNYANTPFTAIASVPTSEERPSSLKSARSDSVLLSSPIQSQMSKSAKTGEGGADGGADVSMGGLPVVPPFPGVGGSGSESSTSDMKMLLNEMKGLRTSFDIKFDKLERQIVVQAEEFKAELVKLRAELVSRVEFEGLEKRVTELEAGGLASSQINWLQDQLNRLDPA